MVKTKHKLGKCALLILAILLIATFIFGGTTFKAQAGTTGSVIADNSDFMGTEIDYRNWKYSRDSGLGVRALRKTFAFTNPTAGTDFALKSKHKTAGNGSIIEMDVRKLDLGNGDLALTYGCFNDSMTESGKPYWKIREQTDPTQAGYGIIGSLQTFNFVDGAVKLTLNKPVRVAPGSGMQPESANSTNSLKFRTGNGSGNVNGDSLVLDFGEHLSGGVLINKTLRVYWDTDGNYEMSVRDIGSELSARYKTLENAEANSIRGALPGYFGLTCLGTGNVMDVDFSDMRIYEIENKNKDTNGDKLVSEFGATEAPIDDYAFICNKSNFEKGALGSLNTMHFSKTYDMENPLISRKEIFASSEIEDAVLVDFNMLINDMTPAKKFGFIFGLNRLDEDVKANNSGFLYFQKSGASILCGLSTFKDGNETKLHEPIAVANATNGIEVNIVIKSNGRIQVMINGAPMYASAKDGEVKASGYLGFSQSGGYNTSTNYIDVELTSLNINNVYYDKPFTPKELNANFTNNEFNVNDLFMKGSQMVIQNEAYVFNGAGENSGFATRMAYSNFELQYTLFDVKTEKHFDPKLGKTFSASAQQGVSFGVDGDSVESAMISTYEAFSKQSYVYFDAEKNADGSVKGTAGMHFIYKGKYQQSLELPSRYNFFKVGFSDKVTIQITMNEGNMSVGLKLPSESTFTNIYTFSNFENNFTSTGYICFWSGGNDFIVNKTYELRSFYKIDDIKIKNLDNAPNIKETEYESNKVYPIADYEYKDSWNDNFLIGNRVIEKKIGNGVVWGIIGMAVGGACLVGTAIVIVVVKRRKKV